MRPIDADALLARYDAEHQGAAGNARRLIEEAPTISPDDVRGVGKWIETAMPSGWYDVTCAECSVCGEDFMLGDYCMDDVRDLFHYCPNCGAKMEVREDA